MTVPSSSADSHAHRRSRTSDTSVRHQTACDTGCHQHKGGPGDSESWLPARFDSDPAHHDLQRSSWHCLDKGVLAECNLACRSHGAPTSLKGSHPRTVDRRLDVRAVSCRRTETSHSHPYLLPQSNANSQFVGHGVCERAGDPLESWRVVY